MGACESEEAIERREAARKKKGKRRFSALPQKRLNLRSEAEAVEVLGMNIDDYKFVCKEGTKDQVCCYHFLLESSFGDSRPHCCLKSKLL